MHRKADPLEHEPCRLLGNLDVSRNLVATDAVLAVSKHPGCREPLIQWNRGVLIDRANLDGELTLRVMAPALPCAPIGIEADLRSSAAGADYAVRPTPDSDVVDAIVRIREVDNCFLKALRFVFHH